MGLSEYSSKGQTRLKPPALHQTTRTASSQGIREADNLAILPEVKWPEMTLTLRIFA